MLSASGEDAGEPTEAQHEDREEVGEQDRPRGAMPRGTEPFPPKVI